jgi:hypothetical protein
MARMLLEGAPVFQRFEISKENLTEEVQIQGSSAATQPLMRFKGLFQKYHEKNANNRVYPKELWDRCLNEEGWLGRLKENSVLGLVEHPEDGITRLTGPISHVITKAYDMGNGEIWGEGILLNTPDGRKIGSLFEAGVPVGISSRGEGEVESMDESTQRVIPESFNLITWDFVADNSVHGAKVKPYTGESLSSKSTKKEESSKPDDRKYLKTPVEKSFMNKIGEMRKADVELKRLINVQPSKLSFQARVGLVDSIREIQAKISQYINEDVAVEAYGKKLLKEADDFADDVESDDFGSDDAPKDDAVEVGPDSGSGDEGCEVEKADFDKVMKAVLKGMCPECGDDEMGGGAPPVPPMGETPMESRRRRSAKGKLGKNGKRLREDFGDEGMPGAGAPPMGGPGAGAPPPPAIEDAPGGDMQSVIDKAYEEFCNTGTIDINSAVAELKGDADSLPGDDAGFDADSAIPGEEPAAPDIGKEASFESRELKASVELIAHLRESAANGEQYRALVEELKERIRIHHPLLKELEEARAKLKNISAGTTVETRIARNKILLARAKEEIANWQKSYNEEKLVSEALATLLKEHGIKDASKLIETARTEAKVVVVTEADLSEEQKTEYDKLDEAGKAAYLKKLGEEDQGKTGGFGTPGDSLELGKGEKATTVGKAPNSSVTTSGGDDIAGIPDGECEDEGEKAPNVKGGDAGGVKLGTGEKATKVGQGGSKGESTEAGDKKDKLEESTEEEHDFLRILTKQRKGAFRSL